MQKGAIPKACKNTQKRAQLGEPVSTRGWARRTSIKPERVGRTSIKRGWANQYLKTTIEKKIPKPLPGPLGRPLKNETPPDPLGEPVGRKRVQPKKACKKHTTNRPEAWAPEDTLPKQAKKQSKNKRKANRLKGAIRVQLGCNQGAIRVQKGAIPKACKNTQKRAQLGEPVLILRACSALLSACSAPPTRCLLSTSYSVLAQHLLLGACSAPPTSACSALFTGACSAPQKIPPPPPQHRSASPGCSTSHVRRPDREKTSGLGGYMPSAIKQKHAKSCHAKIKQMSCHAKNVQKRAITAARI